MLTRRLCRPLHRNSVAVSRRTLFQSTRHVQTRTFVTFSHPFRIRRVVNITPFSIPFRSFASGNYPDHILLTMPALSPTMEKGNLSTWKKNVGDKISIGDVMAEVETDKATVAFEAVEEGYLAKILVESGAQDVPVGKPVAVLAENEDDIEKFKDFKPDGAEEKPAGNVGQSSKDQEIKKTAISTSDKQHQTAQLKEAGSSTSVNEAPPQPSPETKTSDRIFASPNARRVANERGVNLSNIKGTGPDGRIVTADVEEQGLLQSKTAAISAQAEGDFTDISLSNMRKVIAQRLSLSKTTIPHYYLTSIINVDHLLKIRADLNARNAKLEGDNAVKLSVNDLLIKAAALACRKVPQVNSSWQDSFIRQYSYVDVCVAVSTDSGLVTPIVKDADIKGLTQIAADIKGLAAKARANKLSPHEYQGGTFTISNLGMFGVSNFSAIINPPQSAILAVGTTETKITQNSDGSFKQSQFLSVTLSCDHRVVDGAVGAQWLQAFKGYLENPITMLL